MEKWKIVFDHDIEKEREESRRMREFYDGYDFETPAEYLKTAWEGTREAVELTYGTRYDWCVSPSRRERTLTHMEEENMMFDTERPVFTITWAASDRFRIKEVIFNNPATIVYWEDGSKTVVTDTDNMVDGKAKPAESYSKEAGLALCFMKKALGNKGNYNNAFREWIKED